MIVERKNFAKTHLAKLVALDPPNGTQFIQCNFAQANPHTAVLAGKTGLIFTSCNLMNCDVPGDSTIEDCLHIQKSLCSHLHPSKTQLTPCADNCAHVVDNDSVTIDSQLVATIYHYEDTLE